MNKSKKQDNLLKGIIIVFFSTFINALAQYLLKQSSTNFDTFTAILFNYHFIIGVSLYLISAFILIYALKFGPLSTLYPMYSLTFIWVTLISIFIFKEMVSIKQTAGIVSVVFGVLVISRG